MTTYNYAARARFANAVELYRRALDVYRQVVETRARHHVRTPTLAVRQPPRDVDQAPHQLVPRLTALPRSVSLQELTPREREVADLIARGYTNAQIAAELIVTRGTVANHVAHILSKLNLQNRTQLAARVARQQYPEPDRQAAG